MIDMNSLIEVELQTREDFLKVAETLTRMGFSSHKTNTVYQSCHILHKRGKYYIVHFKEMFLLDGKTSDLSESDIQRRNTIANLLQEWKLLKIINPEQAKNVVPVSQIKIIPHKEKKNWNLVSKYQIGKKKNYEK